MIEGELSLEADVDWYYFCKAREAMIPLPSGYVPVLDGEDEAAT